MNPVFLKWFVPACFIGGTIMVGIAAVYYAIAWIKDMIGTRKRHDAKFDAILAGLDALSIERAEILDKLDAISATIAIRFSGLERANQKAGHFAEALYNESVAAKKAATPAKPEQPEPVTDGTYAITPLAISLERLSQNINELGDYSPGPFAGARLVLTSFKYVVDGLRALDAELKSQRPVNQRSATSHDSFAAMVNQQATPQKPNPVPVPPVDTVCVCCKQPATRYCPGWDNSSDLLEPCGGLAMRKSCGESLCNECVHLPYTDRHIPITR